MAILCAIALPLSCACINFGLCVDACDGVMTKLQRPRGLIDYESWKNIERGRLGEARVSRVVRPKTIALTAACLALAAALVVSFAMRTSGAMSVQHDRDSLAVRLSEVPSETRTPSSC